MWPGEASRTELLPRPRAVSATKRSAAERRLARGRFGAGCRCREIDPDDNSIALAQTFEHLGVCAIADAGLDGGGFEDRAFLRAAEKADKSRHLHRGFVLRERPFL